MRQYKSLISWRCRVLIVQLGLGTWDYLPFGFEKV
jgi:hypothetical protein